MKVKQTEEERRARAAAYCVKNKEKIAYRKAAYYAENKVRAAERASTYYAENREKIEARKARYCAENKEKIAVYNAVYRAKNREKINAWFREYHAAYYIENINHRIACVIRNRIRKAVKNEKSEKALKSINLLGCSIAHARQHLESQFLPGMTWENHSPDGWHIDHKKPCSSFDLTDPEQQKACFHYTNLQPLWATDNLSKGKKIDWQPVRQSAQQ